MIVLGLNFGHDASACVVHDGRVLVNISRERNSRVKSAMQLRGLEVDMALAEAGITIDDVDFCAMTTSQGYPYIFIKDSEFSAAYVSVDDAGVLLSRSIESLWRKQFARVDEYNTEFISRFKKSLTTNPSANRQFIDSIEIIENYMFTTENYIKINPWKKSLRLDQVVDQLSPQLFSELQNPIARHGFHFPATLTFRGRQVPAAVCAHHVAHAASTFYLSNFESSAILTVDGSTPAHPGSYKGGLFFYGVGEKIVPIWPHGLGVGGLYSASSSRTGFGISGTGAEGKFMGLSPYGRPAFMDHRYVGCIKTILDNLGITDDYFENKNEPETRWMAHCDARAAAAGYDMSGQNNPDRATDAINADFAASTQKLFEETMLYAVRHLADFCDKLGVHTNRLCLAGGSFLNCPANSRMANESPFDDVYVVPGCDDSGLAVGAALYLMHNVLDVPRAEQNSKSTNAAYLGRTIPRAEIEAAVEAAGDAFDVTPLEDCADDAGRALADDKVIAWYEGRSEFGPRALGHRSVLSDPRHMENWPRVNRMKGREQWRPFAPAVLQEEQETWFSGCPSPSPYMLFTGQVRRPELPAITHLDNSARVQTVARDGGGYRRLIERFFAETNCPVVMNTSLNGPGEPIVETPAEALNFLRNSGVDLLYLDGFKVARKT